jgi:general secretion pathway protein G
MKAAGGFTLIELLVTLVLVGIVASISVPLYEVSSTRLREAELRAALRQIRTAIDAYKTAVDAGLITKGSTESGYPRSLEVLVQGIDTQHLGGRRLVFLRHVPRDPFFVEEAAPAAQHWITRSYGSTADDPQPGDDVYDVASRSTRVGLNGIRYREW